MPDASTIERSRVTLDQLTQIARKTPGVHDIFSVAGFSILTRSNSSAAGLMFVVLDPFEDRVGNPERTGNAIAGRLTAQFSQVQNGLRLIFPPPPVRGIGTAGGFRMQIQDRSGLETPQQVQSTTEAVMAEARKNPQFAALFSSFRANVPQLYANLERTKAKQQNVPITSVFQTLQVFLGGLYINDFNYLNRTYHVTAQADAPLRVHAKDVAQFKTRNADGEMVPLGAVMELRDITGPDRLQRYDLFTSAEINGTAVPGISSGQSIAAMEDAAKKVLPRQYGCEWTDLAFQEKAAGNTALFIFPMCILLVWLVHSAEYESFTLSTAIILIVPMCLLCGIAGVWLRNMDNNIFTQIGFVVLAGLSVKNAVLIVEFAKQQQEHGKLSAFDAAIEAARLRLRPILMTSFAFIFGVLPLIVARGAGAEMRQALGTVVFFGMLGVTIFGLFLTPVFFTVIRKLTGPGM